jgi:hypothetical protein
MSVGAEQETRDNGSPAPIGLPKANVLVQAPNEQTKPPADSEFDGEGDRNTIFDSLVKVEGEVAGLVAYSIYKQNKRAWLQDFLKATGRPPTEAESRAYIIGESTDRRLATYRHLATATLSGQGPEAPTPTGRPSRASSARPGTVYLLWAILLVAVLALAAYAVHTGMIGK